MAQNNCGAGSQLRVCCACIGWPAAGQEGGGAAAAARRHHPDRQGGEGAGIFSICAAWLIDQEFECHVASQ